VGQWHLAAPRGYHGRTRTERGLATLAHAVPALCALALSCSASLAAQEPAGQHRVGRLTGVVYDSTRRIALSGARVAVAGSPRYTVSDDRGRFELDSVPAGRQLVWFSHPELDSVGIFTPTAAARIAEGRSTDIRLATPSLRTLQVKLCGGVSALDTGYVGVIHGTVTDADSRAAVSGAVVVFSWPAIKAVRNMGTSRVVVESVGAQTNHAGSYAACGLPLAKPLRVEVLAGPYRAGETEQRLDPKRPLAKHDLSVSRDFIAMTIFGDTLAVGGSPDSATKGAPAGTAAADIPTMLRGHATLVGVARDTAGNPVVGARVRIPGTGAEGVTDDAGRIRFEDLPGGSFPLSVRAIGYAPIDRTIGLRGRDSTHVDIALVPVVALREVHVTAEILAHRDRDGFERRRRDGHGYYVLADTTDLDAKVGKLLSDVPNILVREPIHIILSTKGQQCRPDVFIDGLRSGAEFLLTTYRARDIRAIEVYAQRAVPAEFQSFNRCGAVLAWTKAAAW
jgi:carboxypeptidase family protein